MSELLPTWTGQQSELGMQMGISQEKETVRAETIECNLSQVESQFIFEVKF